MPTTFTLGVSAGLALTAGLLLPVTASADDEAPDTRGISRTIACAFYADEGTYIDTGVGIAANRTVAREAYECPLRPDTGSGSGGGDEEPTDPEPPTDPPAEAG